MNEIIIALIGGLLSGGGISTFFFIKQERRSKDIENEAKQSEEWRKLYEREREEVSELHVKIDELYAKISQHRDEKAAKSVRIAELEVENTRLKLLMCQRPGCKDREPQTGY